MQISLILRFITMFLDPTAQSEPKIINIIIIFVLCQSVLNLNQLSSLKLYESNSSILQQTEGLLNISLCSLIQYFIDDFV